MITAFWNINTGPSSFDHRLQTLARWVDEVKPALLMLCEVGHGLLVKPASGQRKIEAALGGYELAGFVDTRDKSGGTTSLCLAALALKGSGFKATSVSADNINLKQARNLLKVEIQPQDGAKSYPVWGLHADPTLEGGRRACEAIAAQLGTAAGAGAVFGGDFNATAALAEKSGLTVSRPRGYYEPGAGDGKPVPPADGIKLGMPAGPPMRATHWKVRAGTTPGATRRDKTARGNEVLRNHRSMGVALVPADLIDYAVARPANDGGARTITPLANCLSHDTWDDILAQFDHAPVVYHIA
ncbi:MAG: endonuclease/exonuclease/phosphatase family protein [Pseudomonadota bacterium]